MPCVIFLTHVSYIDLLMDFDVVSMHLLMVVVDKIETAADIIGPQNGQTHS